MAIVARGTASCVVGAEVGVCVGAVVGSVDGVAATTHCVAAVKAAIDARHIKDRAEACNFMNGTPAIDG